MRKNAEISSCGKYRYALWRHWNEGLQQVDFIMLNPSTADHKKDDPTIRRCINYAKMWGAGSIRVLNLFAYRATDPRELKKVSHPVGPENDYWLNDHGSNCDRIDPTLHVVCAWGNHGSYMGRSKIVYQLLLDRWRLTEPKCLKVTKQGEPNHPLFLEKNLLPFRYHRKVKEKNVKTNL